MGIDVHQQHCEDAVTVVDAGGEGVDKQSGIVNGEHLSDCPQLTELIEAVQLHSYWSYY